MKKLILTSATVLFLGLTAMACEGDKGGKHCEKKCDKKECTKDASCKKDGKHEACKKDEKACKSEKSCCDKKGETKSEGIMLKPAESK